MFSTKYSIARILCHCVVLRSVTEIARVLKCNIVVYYIRLSVIGLAFSVIIIDCVIEVNKSAFNILSVSRR